jgi:hypothetical protein
MSDQIQAIVKHHWQGTVQVLLGTRDDSQQWLITTDRIRGDWKIGSRGSLTVEAGKAVKFEV